MPRWSAGVFGATGYVGRELVRLLRGHPYLSLAFATGSERAAGSPSRSPALLAHEAGLERSAEVYFLCLPHGVAGRYAALLHQRHPRALIVDLSGDLRLPTPASYREWYGHEHPAPELLGRVPYGLSELSRTALRGAPLVSNPGCYATAALLPLVPLLRSGLIDPDDIVIDAKSGASGAGRTLREDLLFCDLDGDFRAYSPGRTHRHVGEMEAVLAAHTRHAPRLTFCPHLLPVKRGILSTLHLKSTQTPEALADALRAAYAGAPYVRVLGAGPSTAPPALADVVHTNDCLISVHAAAPGRVVLFSALDNLMKGAAGQAVQNANLALGLDEAAGLPPGHALAEAARPVSA